MKTNINIATIALLASLAGCGAPLIQAQPTTRPASPSKMDEAEREENMRSIICLAAGVPDERCFKLKNALAVLGPGGQKAFMLVMVNDAPVPVRPLERGAQPGKLLPGETMFLPLAGCERQGSEFGRRYCAFNVWAEAYPIKTLAFAQRQGNRLRQRLMNVPDVEETSRTCYNLNIKVFNSGRGAYEIAHMAHDSVPCPGNQDI